MLYLYKQSESIDARRRVYMVLVDSTDGITEKTGQSGTVYLSKNGTTQAQSTNSLVEVDSVNLPGHYYVELTASELDTLGFLSVRYKAAGTAAFQWVGQVVADDPYINHSGPGMSGGGGRSASGLKKEEMIEIAKMVWNVIVRGKQTAKDVLLDVLDKPEFDPEALPDAPDVDLTPVLKELAALEKLEQLDTLVDGQKQTFTALKGLKIPDSGKQLTRLEALLATLAVESKSHTQKLNSFDPKQLSTLLTASAAQIESALESFQEAVENASGTTDRLEEVRTLVADVSDQVAEAMNLNNQFKEMSDKLTNKQLEELKGAVQMQTKQLLIAIENAKYKLGTQLIR